MLAGLDSLRAGRRQLRTVAAELASPPPNWTPPVTLIVPLKGLEPGLAENLQSLAEQDYPDYELIVAVHAADDPAVDLVNAKARLVVAGPGRTGTGEKINNLLAAVAVARPASEVLAFADSDGRVTRGWLRGLVAPLRDPAVGAATGYRWYQTEAACGPCCAACGTRPSPGRSVRDERTLPGEAQWPCGERCSSEPEWPSFGMER